MNNDKLIKAAEKYAELYDGDPRQDIKVDVMNAYFGGWKFSLDESKQAVPFWWKLVPIEPTDVMIYMMTRATANYAERVDSYRAMLDAAPQPPVSEPAIKPQDRDKPTITENELRAIVMVLEQSAKSFGLKVMTHAMGGLFLEPAEQEGAPTTPFGYFFEGPEGLRMFAKTTDYIKPVLDLHDKMAAENPSKYKHTALYTHQQVKAEPIRCAWEADDEGIYQTQCGHAFEFTAGTPEENAAKYCCYCGGQLIELSHGVQQEGE